MKDDQSRRFLIAAIIWTVVAAAACALLIIATGDLFGKICGGVLVIMCVLGQWLRYFKNR